MLVNLFSTEMPDPKKIEEVLNKKFLSKEKFAEDIESLVLETKMSYIDAIVQYCEDNNIEVDSVNKLVSKPLKEKIRWEATELNYLKKTSHGRLPL
jgi:hypothetical protein